MCLPHRGTGTEAASVEVTGKTSVAFHGPDHCWPVLLPSKKERILWQVQLSDKMPFPPLPLLLPFLSSSKGNLCALACSAALALYLNTCSKRKERKNPESYAFPSRLAPSLQLSSAGAACQSHASTNRCDSRALSVQWKRHYSLNCALKAAKCTSLRIFHWDRRFLRALLLRCLDFGFLYLFIFPPFVSWHYSNVQQMICVS